MAASIPSFIIGHQIQNVLGNSAIGQIFVALNCVSIFSPYFSVKLLRITYGVSPLALGERLLLSHHSDHSRRTGIDVACQRFGAAAEAFR